MKPSEAMIEAAGIAVADYLSTLNYATNLATIRLQHGEGIAHAALTAALALLPSELSDEDRGLWACPDCAFAFDAIHTDNPHGGYSCPVCELTALGR